MREHTGQKSAGKELTRPETGLGVSCWEAQADGVPCDELGTDCTDCERVEAPSVRPESERPPTT
jgi:hypothetical protein